ncbi:hypothetical protein [Paraburkholderia terricola]|uniref:hypothetical protein n=1 Tax=Paraburkholderia terricola TaxID=169427 RepID=UPI0012601BE9
MKRSRVAEKPALMPARAPPDDDGGGAPAPVDPTGLAVGTTVVDVCGVPRSTAVVFLTKLLKSIVVPPPISPIIGTVYVTPGPAAKPYRPQRNFRFFGRANASRVISPARTAFRSGRPKVDASRRYPVDTPAPLLRPCIPASRRETRASRGRLRATSTLQHDAHEPS